MQIGTWVFLLAFVASIYIACQKPELPVHSVLPTDYWEYRRSSLLTYFYPSNKYDVFHSGPYFTSSYYQVHVAGEMGNELILFFNLQPDVGTYQVVNEFTGAASDQLHLVVAYNSELTNWDMGKSGQVIVAEDENGNRVYTINNVLTQQGSVKGTFTLN